MKWGDLMEAAMKQSQLHDIYFPEKKEKSANLILQQSTDTGTGEMTCYDVAPGIQITYNHLNMDSCYQPLIPKEDFLQIDHCLEGCYECECFCLTGALVYHYFCFLESAFSCKNL